MVQESGPETVEAKLGESEGGRLRRKVEAAIDAVRAKLGKSSIGKGRGIEIKRR